MQKKHKKYFPGSGTTPPARVMPHNLQAEQNLLGAILLDNSVIERIDDRLLADHFYDPFHGRIFSTMQRLIERGQLANPVTLKSFFTDYEDFQSDSSETYLSELADGVISITQAPDFPYVLSFSFDFKIFASCLLVATKFPLRSHIEQSCSKKPFFKSLAMPSIKSLRVAGNCLMFVVKLNVGIQPIGPYLLVTTGGKISEK